MKIAIVGTMGKVQAGDILRLERKNEEYTAYKNGYNPTGKVSKYSWYESKSDEVLTGIGDMLYCIAAEKAGAVVLADVIIPIEFSISNCRKSVLKNG